MHFKRHIHINVAITQGVIAQLESSFPKTPRTSSIFNYCAKLDLKELKGLGNGPLIFR